MLCRRRRIQAATATPSISRSTSASRLIALVIALRTRQSRNGLGNSNLPSGGDERRDVTAAVERQHHDPFARALDHVHLRRRLQAADVGRRPLEDDLASRHPFAQLVGTGADRRLTSVELFHRRGARGRAPSPRSAAMAQAGWLRCGTCNRPPWYRSCRGGRRRRPHQHPQLSWNDRGWLSPDRR